MTNKTETTTPSGQDADWELVREVIYSWNVHGSSIETKDNALTALDRLRNAAPVVPDGWQLVPKEPTEEMWGELARHIVFWNQINKGPHYGSNLHDYLRNCGHEIPAWLSEEIPDTMVSPPKGTITACIYKAMLSAAPTAPVVGQTEDDGMLPEGYGLDLLFRKNKWDLGDWCAKLTSRDTHNQLVQHGAYFGPTPRAAVLAAIKAINGGG